MPTSKIHVYVFDFAPRKDTKPKNKRITKIGISNAPKRRFDEVTKDGELKGGRILHNCIIQNAEKVEGQLHRKYERQNIRFQTPFSGFTEFFDISPTEQNSVIGYLKSLTIGTYSEDYEEANPLYILLIIVGIFGIYFLTL